MSKTTKCEVSISKLQRCLICEKEVTSTQNVDSNPETCKRFLKLSSRFLNLDSISNNLWATLNTKNLKNENFTGRFCCDICFPYISTFCDIYKQWSYLRLQLNVRANEIAKLMKPTPGKNEVANKKVLPQKLPNFQQSFVQTVKQNPNNFPRIHLKKVKNPADCTTDTEEGIRVTIVIEPEHSDSTNKNIPKPPQSPLPSTTPPPQPPQNLRTGRRFRCRLCGARYQSLTNLTSHLLRIHQKRPKITIGKGKSENKTESKEKENASSSITTTAIKNRDDSETCSVCGKTFATKYNRFYHEQTHFISNAKTKCSFCTKEFENLVDYKHHLRMAHDLANNGTNGTLMNGKTGPGDNTENGPVNEPQPKQNGHGESNNDYNNDGVNEITID